MTDAAKSAETAPATKGHISPGLKLALELGPLVLFFAGNSYGGIYAATGIFMVATVAALAAMWVLARRIAVMPLVSALVVMVFGTLTLVLQDDHFIKLKPTMVNALFGVLLLGGLVFRKPLLPYVFRRHGEADRARLVSADGALGGVLPRHGGGERDRVAEFFHRHLGQLQDLRLSAAHHRLRHRAGAAHGEI